MPTPFNIPAQTVKFVLIGVLLILTACGGAKIITDKQTGLSIVDGGLVSVYDDGNISLFAKLMYEKPEHYSLLVQNLRRNTWKFRNSKSFFGEEELRSEIVFRTLLPNSGTSQVLHLDVSRRHINIALQDQLLIKNNSWTGESIEFKIPAGYTQIFMEKVAQFDPSQKL